MFEIGDRVAYPMHGAGSVELIEEKEILGQLQRYYVLRFALGGMKVMVPVEGKDIGLRAIIGKEEGMKVLEFLSQPCGEEFECGSCLYPQLDLEKMRTGSIFDTAEVVRALSHRDKEKGLSTGEKKMLNSAKQILASELILSLDMEEQDVLARIEQAV